MVKPILIVIILSSIFCGCAAHISPDNNWMRVYRTGIVSHDVGDGLLIDGFDSDSAAKESGLQVGDIILTINAKKKSNLEFIKMMHYNRGETLLFKVNRNGQIIDFSISPKVKFTVSPSSHKIYELINLDNQKVNLAVIIDVIVNVPVANANSWAASFRQKVQGDIEGDLLNNFGRSNSFALIDRTQIDKLIAEFKINMTGLISDDARTQIGKMTGATHLLVVSYAVNTNDTGSCVVSMTTSRLIELVSGAV